MIELWQEVSEMYNSNYRPAYPQPAYPQIQYPQQMDMTARNAVQSSGVNPNDIMRQMQKYI